jgi:3-phosphoglycerate kinase
MRSNTLEDDSPVQYPEVRNYQEWYTLNGKLILVSSKFMMPLKDGETPQKPKVSLDTLEFLYMDNDSLILLSHGTRIGFHRKENALKANAEATKAQNKQDAKK